MNRRVIMKKRIPIYDPTPLRGQNIYVCEEGVPLGPPSDDVGPSKGPFEVTEILRQGENGEEIYALKCSTDKGKEVMISWHGVDRNKKTSRLYQLLDLYEGSPREE